MKNGLSKRVVIDDSPEINIFDIATKQIIFSGPTKDAEVFLGVKQGYLSYYLKTKYRLHRKYAIRPKAIS